MMDIFEMTTKDGTQPEKVSKNIYDRIIAKSAGRPNDLRTNSTYYITENGYVYAGDKNYSLDKLHYTPVTLNDFLKLVEKEGKKYSYFDVSLIDKEFTSLPISHLSRFHILSNVFGYDEEKLKTVLNFLSGNNSIKLSDSEIPKNLLKQAGIKWSDLSVVQKSKLMNGKEISDMRFRMNTEDGTAIEKVGSVSLKQDADGKVQINLRPYSEHLQAELLNIFKLKI